MDLTMRYSIRGRPKKVSDGRRRAACILWSAARKKPATHSMCRSTQA